MKTYKVNLIFKIREDKLVTFITNVNGNLYGVAEKVSIPKTKIELNCSDYPFLDSKTEYQCVLDENNNVISIKKIEYPVSINYIETESGNKIMVKVHKKRLYFDPNNGVTKHSSTIDGTIRAINMCNNNFNKAKTIERLLKIYREKFPYEN